MVPFCSTVRKIFFPDGLQTVNKPGLYQLNEIEAWGRGVERIFAACEAAGSPKPVLRYDP